MSKTQLFLLHFAGGNSYSFQFLLPFLQEFEVIPLELPGRGRRIREPLIRDFDEAAEDLFLQIRDRLNHDRFALYGHSMGAYLGLRIVAMLEQVNKYPAWLFVSGNAGPGTLPKRNRYLFSKPDFIEELRRLGGVPAELLENEDLLGFYLPIIRADFEIVEKEDRDTEPVIKTPVFVMMGNRETTVDKISNWSNFTSASFKQEIFDGGHFFIRQHAGRVAGIIKDVLSETEAVDL